MALFYHLSGFSALREPVDSILAWSSDFHPKLYFKIRFYYYAEVRRPRDQETAAIGQVISYT